MILGRSPALWTALAGAAINVAVVVFGLALTDVQIGALNAFALVLTAVLANSADHQALADAAAARK